MITHLDRLEAEAINIMREVVAEASKPVMLYSIGKDSAVMLHLAVKAFYPAPPPFPLLHVDTTWKFREMISFRDQLAAKLGFDLIVHINQEGLKQGIGPFTHGSAVHTDIMKTQALKQALDQYGFDTAFGGARRDEEKVVPRSVFFLSALPSIAGTPRTNALRSGRSTTPEFTRARRSAYFLYQTGRSSIFGNIYAAKRSPLFRFILLRSALLSRATAL